MPEGVGYGAQNTVSIGKELNVIGKHIYGYSGSVAVTDSPAVTLIDFTTGAYYVVGSFQPTNFTDSGDDIIWKILFAGQEVAQSYLRNHAEFAPFEEVELIIPPFTNIEITAYNATGSTSRNVGALITGTVYK